MIDTHFHPMRPATSKSGLNGNKFLHERELKAAMKRYGILGGIAVQPSIYRYDNSHLLAVLKQYPQTMRGVGVVPETIQIQQLEELKKQGIIGIRLNMINNPDQYKLPPRDFIRKLSDAGLFLQVHSKAYQLAEVIHFCMDSRVSLVVDHIGNPNPKLDIRQPGFNEMIESAREGGVLIKLSAPFRIAEHGEPFKIAQEFAKAALDQVPLDRFIVGTDWPFINTDHKPSMETIFNWFRELLPDEIDWKQVAVENARKLAGISTGMDPL